MVILGGLKLSCHRHSTLKFIRFRHLTVPCSSFLGSESSTSEDSSDEFLPSNPDYSTVETVKPSVFYASKLERGNFVQRKYSFSRSWSSKEDMMNRIQSVLQLRGWDLGFQNALMIELDESNVSRILNDLFDGSADAALAFYFFRWSQRYNESKHGLKSICTMIHISVLGNMNHIAVNFLHDVVQINAGGEECHDLLLDVLRETSKDRKVLETIYSMLVSCYVDRGMIEMALNLIHHMETLGSFPALGVCCTLLKLLLKSRQLELAQEVFRRMLRHWRDFGAPIISLFIHECCAQGNFADACKLLSEMRNCGCKVDVVVYTILFDALCRSGLLKEATSLFYKMIQVGISPDSVLIASVIDGYCKAGRLVEAMGILKASGCAPDIFVYNSFISKLCNDGQMEEATWLFDEMSELGMFPDCCNYTTIIGGYCKVLEISQALKSFGKMLKRGLKPAVLTYTLLIECYCKISDLQGAEYLLNSMKREDVRPDVVIYNVLFNGYSKMDHLQRAFELLYTMRADGISPDVATYNIFIHGLTKRGLLKESREILVELVMRGFYPDEFTYANNIYGFSMQGSFQKALHMWCHMIEGGMKPDVITCGALINGFCKAKRMQEANALFRKMLEAGLVPDLVLYNKLIRGFCSEGNTQDAFWLISMMANNGVIPNDVTYCALVHGLKKSGVLNAIEIADVRIQLILLKNGIVVDEAPYVTTCAWVD